MRFFAAIDALPSLESMKFPVLVEPLNFPDGNVLYMEATGTTVVRYATWPSVDYPVDQLFPVENNNGETLIAALQAYFS